MLKPAHAKLLALSRAGRLSDPRATFDALASACLSPDSDAGPQEMGIFYDILRRLLPSLAAEDRREAAARLAGRDDLPRDLARRLIFDDIAIAFPVIVSSAALDDDDLVTLVPRSARHRIALSMRTPVGARLTEALVDSGDTDAALTLLRNDRAAISPATMVKLVDLSRDAPDCQALLLARPDLPEPLAERMYDWVSEAVRAHAGEHDVGESGSDEPGGSPGLADADAGAIVPFEGRPAEEEPATEGATAAAPLLDALAGRDIVRFEALFARLTRLPTATAERVLYEAGPEALATACKAVGLSPDEFTEILFRLNGAQDRRGFAATPAVRQAVAHFEAIERTAAHRIVALWRNAPTDGWSR